MVPEGWLERSIGELDFDISDGNYSAKYPKQADFCSHGTPFLRANNIRNGTVVDSDMRYISDEMHNDLKKGHLKKEDILVTTRGELGNLAFVPDRHVGSNINAQLVRINSKGVIHRKFLYYCLNQAAITGKFNSLSTGTALKQLPIGKLKQLKIRYPESKYQQKKIAQILSTWDQAITATERLLENSQQRKKGLMQQLLTGKKRLPGFEGEWKKIELGDALDYQQPTPFLVKSTEYSDDFPTPVLTAGKSFLLGYTDETFGIYDEGLPVIIFDDFTTASQFVDFPFKAKSSAMKMLTPKHGYSIRYIFEAMRMIRFAVGGHQRHWISIFANLVIPCPSLEEQNAISEVIATADKELSAIQSRLDMLKQEKKALMQQLLTGMRRVQVEAA